MSQEAYVVRRQDAQAPRPVAASTPAETAASLSQRAGEQDKAQVYPLGLFGRTTRADGLWLKLLTSKRRRYVVILACTKENQPKSTCIQTDELKGRLRKINACESTNAQPPKRILSKRLESLIMFSRLSH